MTMNTQEAANNTANMNHLHARRQGLDQYLMSEYYFAIVCYLAWNVDPALWAKAVDHAADEVKRLATDYTCAADYDDDEGYDEGYD